VIYNVRLPGQLVEVVLGQSGDFSRGRGRDRTLHIVTLGVVETVVGVEE
jgi:hypothetical protein